MAIYVPKITLSKGTARKNKFDLSTYTHTSSEVGYFQPTYSKLLMPNSDLKIKVEDSVLMSSLVCPTFGDLYLRHWFTATPVSSLWASLGAFLSGRDFTDLDSPTGHGKYVRMPEFSINEMLGAIKAESFNSDETAHNLMYGNLTYFIDNTLVTKDNNGKRNWSEILFSFEHKANSNTACGLLSLVNGLNSYGFEYSDEGFFMPTGQLSVKDSLARYRSPIDMKVGGIVIQNNQSWVNRSLDSAGNPTLPSPEDCPYLVLYCDSESESYDHIVLGSEYVTTSADQDTMPVVGTVIPSSWFVKPLTMRMYQGDTDVRLYDKSGVSCMCKVVAEGATRVCRMVTSAVSGIAPFVLADDDSYFTGDLSKSKFDYYNYCQTTLLGSSVFFKTCANWSRRYKRMRKMYIGFGSQFNPHDTQPQTPWKLMAYYKSWFDMMYPKRDIQYMHTPLARLVNFMSYHSYCCAINLFDNMYTRREYFLSDSDNTNATLWYDRLHDFIDLIVACCDARYLNPIDYYSLADPYPDRSLEDGNDGRPAKDEWIGDNACPTGIGSEESDNTPNHELSFGGVGNVSSNNYLFGSHSVTPRFGTLDGWTNKLATKMLTYLTKKRVVGKSISDTMRAIFGGVDEHDKAHESCWCFGNCQTKISISAVMSQSETEEMHLGDYAGRGIGGSTSRLYSIENNTDLLVVLCMSAIVPKMCYYQGISRENMIGISPNEFCKPIWDAVGYDDVKASEYIGDYVDYSSNENDRNQDLLNGSCLGLVPRYTWYKVCSHDVVNGDMSLPSTSDSMKPYVLTREVVNNFDTDALSMRTFDSDTFNRIFNESSSLDDHFIVQCKFYVDMYAPLKSISTSFETMDEDEDGTIDVQHS